jgi:hypothetical protein
MRMSGERALTETLSGPHPCSKTKSRSNIIEGEGEGGSDWFRSSEGTLSQPGTSQRPQKAPKYPLHTLFIDNNHNCAD